MTREMALKILDDIFSPSLVAVESIYPLSALRNYTFSIALWENAEAHIKTDNINDHIDTVDLFDVLKRESSLMQRITPEFCQFYVGMEQQLKMVLPLITPRIQKAFLDYLNTHCKQVIPYLTQKNMTPIEFINIQQNTDLWEEKERLWIAFCRIHLMTDDCFVDFYCHQKVFLATKKLIHLPSISDCLYDLKDICSRLGIDTQFTIDRSESTALPNDLIPYIAKMGNYARKLYLEKVQIVGTDKDFKGEP